VRVATLLEAARNLVQGSLREEDGQGLAEYALILVLIAILSIVALLIIGSQISQELSVIGTSV
jgi:pilus assembly protein Flp/PilA